MCGIVGVLGKNFERDDIYEALCELKTRGPDAHGLVFGNEDQSVIIQEVGQEITPSFIIQMDKLANFASGHTRFSIIDIDSRSTQPFSMAGVHLTFNGEVFNFEELRGELEEFHCFKTCSDTEVVLVAYLHWGVDCFKKFNGFWALAIIDENKKELILARDRYGEKPLYTCETNNSFTWASEIKALLPISKTNPKISNKAVLEYIAYDRRNTLSSCMIENFGQVDPGFYVRMDLFERTLIQQKKYYNLPVHQNMSCDTKFRQTQFDDCFLRAVDRRLKSDVPLGISISGGIDSSAIAVAMRELYPNKTFQAYTIKYQNDDIYDETAAAQKICDHLAMELNIIDITAEDSWQEFENAMDVSEEPTHSFATVTQLLAWRKIRADNCKVLLHGSGADELLYGYQYLAEICDIDKIKSGVIPSRIQGKHLLSYKSLGRIAKWFLQRKVFGYKNIKSRLDYFPFNEKFKNELVMHDIDIISLLRNSNRNAESRRWEDFDKLRIPYWCSLMDKNMMSIPIEVRCPFLDFELVDYCMQKSSTNFYKQGITKYPLRQFMNKKLPDEIVWNNIKTGFSAPMDSWIEMNDDSMFLAIQEYCCNLLDMNKLGPFWLKADSLEKWRMYSLSQFIKKYELT